MPSTCKEFFSGMLKKNRLITNVLWKTQAGKQNYQTSRKGNIQIPRHFFRGVIPKSSEISWNFPEFIMDSGGVLRGLSWVAGIEKIPSLLPDPSSWHFWCANHCTTLKYFGKKIHQCLKSGEKEISLSGKTADQPPGLVIFLKIITHLTELSTPVYSVHSEPNIYLPWEPSVVRGHTEKVQPGTGKHQKLHKLQHCKCKKKHPGCSADAPSAEHVLFGVAATPPLQTNQGAVKTKQTTGS